MGCYKKLQMVSVLSFPLHYDSRSVAESTLTLFVAIINWLSSQLTKQKKNDFKPKDDDLSFARVNTEPCEACCDLLEKVRDVAKETLSGKNLEVFLTTIGVAFHT